MIASQLQESVVNLDPKGLGEMFAGLRVVGSEVVIPTLPRGRLATEQPKA